MADDADHDADHDAGTGPTGDPELDDAVEEALALEVKRQKARFVQQILGLDRIEGVGRGDERWGEGFDRRHDAEDPGDPPG